MNAQGRTLDIFSAIGGGWRAFTGHWKPFAMIGAYIGVVYGLINILLHAMRTNASGFTALLLSLLGIAVSVVVQAVVQGMLIRGAKDVHDGNASWTVATLYEAVRPRLASLIVTSILAGFLILIGFILVVIPGIVLMIWWSFVAAVVVLEGAHGSAALRRSREIVSGNWWRVFGLVIIVGIVSSIISVIVGGILGFLGGYAGSFVTELIVSAFVTPPAALMVAFGYFQLTDDDTTVAS